jgi:hypothetical protein
MQYLTVRIDAEGEGIRVAFAQHLRQLGFNVRTGALLRVRTRGMPTLFVANS